MIPSTNDATKMFCLGWAATHDQALHSPSKYRVKAFAEAADWLGECRLTKRPSAAVPISLWVHRFFRGATGSTADHDIFVAALAAQGIPFKRLRTVFAFRIGIDARSRNLREAANEFYAERR